MAGERAWLSGLSGLARSESNGGQTGKRLCSVMSTNLRTWPLIAVDKVLIVLFESRQGSSGRSGIPTGGLDQLVSPRTMSERAVMTANQSPDGLPWTLLDTPCLLVDLHRLERNVVEMARRAEKASVSLRPHFKTHKSVAIAEMQRSEGISGFTVSKLDEAEVLMNAGFDDVLVATQVVSPPKLERAVRLSKLGRLIVGVDSRSGVEALSEVAMSAGMTLSVSIEVDSGLKRCGVRPGDVGKLAAVITDAPRLELAGAFTHAGHSYMAASIEQVVDVASEEIEAMDVASQSAGKLGMDVGDLSIGSTPTILARDRYPGIDEIRPGNYVFLDNMQVALGVASREACALQVAATVMSRPTRDRAVVDAGSKSLGLDKGAHGVGSIDDYGILVDDDGRLTRLSEEHGVLEIPPHSSLREGDKVRIWPNHACSVANLHRHYFGLHDGQVDEILQIDAAGAIH